MPVVVDDHLLRDHLIGRVHPKVAKLGSDGFATTGLWLFRLCSSFAHKEVVGKLSAPLAALPADLQERFGAQLVAPPADVTVLGMRELAWPMAQLQERHHAAGRPLNAAMVEALAAARLLGASIAVSRGAVGPNLKAAATADGIAFHVV